MLKELAQYITGLAVEAQKTEVMEINGETYIDGKRLMPDACNYKELNTLDAAIDFLRVTCRDGDFEYPLIVSATHKDIEVYSSLDKYKKRNYVLTVSPTTPQINFNFYMDLEEFIIQLQTCFVNTDNKRNLLELISSFVESEKLEVADNGISQTVTVEKGSAVKSKDDVEVNPFVKLAAYRTYTEVMQPETMYLLRVKQGNRIALYEADGGKWKLEAQKRVAEYLHEGLSDLIEDGKVVVIG
ncbi:hypothetical protein [Dielma fastidiosa]|uniref:hypothetical protein n=1 Tax=Dielma fastidiosa TaxID=1034346 RepID=UPI0023F35B99|nr:hypothetical protein [Dielma fastidiosa]